MDKMANVMSQAKHNPFFICINIHVQKALDLGHDAVSTISYKYTVQMFLLP